MRHSVLLTSLFLVFVTILSPSSVQGQEPVADALKALLDQGGLKADADDDADRGIDHCERAKIVVRHFCVIEPFNSRVGAKVLRVKQNGPADGILERKDFVLIAIYKTGGASKVVAIGCRPGFMNLCKAIDEADAGKFMMFIVRNGQVMIKTIDLS